MSMSVEEFDAALSALDWKQVDFCRMTGLNRNAPSRCRNEGVRIPGWVPQHLALLLDIKRLHAQYLTPPKAGHDASLLDDGGE